MLINISFNSIRSGNVILLGFGGISPFGPWPWGLNITSPPDVNKNKTIPFLVVVFISQPSCLLSPSTRRSYKNAHLFDLFLPAFVNT